MTRQRRKTQARTAADAVAVAAAIGVCLTAAGCSFAPKSFRKVNDAAPITRARSVSLGRSLPSGRVVPALLDRLDDRDPVVRLAAYEELHKGTGQTFGYVPWATEGERKSAVERWREWWRTRQPALARTGRKR